MTEQAELVLQNRKSMSELRATIFRRKFISLDSVSRAGKWKIEKILLRNEAYSYIGM